MSKEAVMGGELVEGTHLLVAGLAMHQVERPDLAYFSNDMPGGPVRLEAIVQGSQQIGNSRPNTSTASGGGGNKPR